MDSDTAQDKKKPKSFQNALFLGGVAGMAAFGGFGMMLAKSRKMDPTDFQTGVSPNGNLESGSKLAMRALGRATVYSVTGFSLFCFTVWKLMGVHSLPEFTAKMQGIMPKIPPAKTGDGKDVDWNELFDIKESKSSEHCISQTASEENS